MQIRLLRDMSKNTTSSEASSTVKGPFWETATHFNRHWATSNWDQKFFKFLGPTGSLLLLSCPDLPHLKATRWKELSWNPNQVKVTWTHLQKKWKCSEAAVLDLPICVTMFWIVAALKHYPSLSKALAPGAGLRWCLKASKIWWNTTH